jgi:hypothetical protein
MHPKHVIPALALALALALAPAAAAQKPPKPPKGGSAVSLDAKPTIIVHGSATTLSGRVAGPTVAGLAVRLEADTTRPYGDGYRPTGLVAMTTTSGAYSLAVKPLLNTQYRAIAQTSPRVTSPPKLVLVRFRVGLKLSDSTPRRGSLVRFSGSVFPARDGRIAHIQKRSPTGRFVTVARTTLRDAGDARSSYNRRVRVYRDGVYRVKVPGDSQNINGFSRLRRITVG